MTALESRKSIQRLLGVPGDGAFGPKTQAAYDRLKSAPEGSEWPPVVIPVPLPVGTEFDERTEKNLATLNAGSQALMRQFMAKLVPYMAAKGVVAKIISGTRTFAEQAELYAKGRTAPGPKVTNAKPGQSNHNWRCAADIGLFKDGDYLDDSPLYKEAGPIGESVGLKWGGRWKNPVDYPHFEALQFKQAAT